jgi:hypothetical protein
MESLFAPDHIIGATETISHVGRTGGMPPRDAIGCFKRPN